MYRLSRDISGNFSFKKPMDIYAYIQEHFIDHSRRHPWIFESVNQRWSLFLVKHHIYLFSLSALSHFGIEARE